jgi:hypothetical protein
MALSKAAKKRKKAGQTNTGVYALSYNAQKGATYSASVRDRKRQDRKNAKQALNRGDW